MKILKKIVNNVGRNWHVQLNPTLWAYHTSIHTLIGATPYALVYGLDSILPIELELPSLRVSLKGIILEEDYRVSRLQELELLDEHHHHEIDHLKSYQ